jgi:hypothetical protein
MHCSLSLRAPTNREEHLPARAPSNGAGGTRESSGKRVAALIARIEAGGSDFVQSIHHSGFPPSTLRSRSTKFPV